MSASPLQGIYDLSSAQYQAESCQVAGPFLMSAGCQQPLQARPDSESCTMCFGTVATAEAFLAMAGFCQVGGRQHRLRHLQGVAAGG